MSVETRLIQSAQGKERNASMALDPMCVTVWMDLCAEGRTVFPWRTKDTMNQKKIDQCEQAEAQDSDI